MGFKNNRMPFRPGNGGNPGPATLGPGVPQFMDSDVVLTVTIKVDKMGTMKLTATPTPHPLSLIKLLTGIIQGQADYLLMQNSMIIDPNKPKVTNDSEKTNGQQGEPETTDDNRGNPSPIH